MPSAKDRHSESAGPHFNPAGKQHGLRIPMGPHAGDMNNFMVRANGTARVTIADPRVNLGSNAVTSARAGTGPQPDTNSIQLPTIKRQ